MTLALHERGLFTWPRMGRDARATRSSARRRRAIPTPARPITGTGSTRWSASSPRRASPTRRRSRATTHAWDHAADRTPHGKPIELQPQDFHRPRLTHQHAAGTRMTTATVGAAKITRIEETYGIFFEAKTFFADWRDEIVAEHMGWMVPDHYDPATGFLKLSIHSLAARDRRPENPDRHLRRQSQIAQASAVLGQAQHALSRAARGGRREAGGHRHGDVHAPARRSRRLEHAARQRPLGADIPEREVRLQQDRLRPFPRASIAIRRKGPAIGGALRDSVLPIVEAGLCQMVDGARDDRGASRARRPRPATRPVTCIIKLASQGRAGVLLRRHHPSRRSRSITRPGTASRASIRPTARQLAAR